MVISFRDLSRKSKYRTWCTAWGPVIDGSFGSALALVGTSTRSPTLLDLGCVDQGGFGPGTGGSIKLTLLSHPRHFTCFCENSLSEVLKQRPFISTRDDKSEILDNRPESM